MHPRRPILTLLAAFALVATALTPSLAAPTLQDGDLAFRVERLGGTDRYAVAARVSTRFSPSPAPVVYVAAGTAYADALSAGPVAARAGAPLLFVRRDSVPTATRGELLRLRPGTVVVVGGPGAVADSVLADLRTLTGATVSRLAGADRFATSVAASRSTFSSARVVHVATGRNWPDALAAGAAAVALGGPVLLSDTGSVPDAVQAELRRLAPERILLVGGTAAVSEQAAEQLRAIAPTERIGGTDRYAVALALSTRVFGPARPGVFLASGLDFPDALAAVPATRVTRGPILLARHGSIPGSGELDRLTPRTAYLLGGTAALSDDVARAAQRERGVCWSGDPGKPSTQQVLTRVEGTTSRKMAFTLDLGGRLDGATQIVDTLVANQVCTTFFPTSIMADTAQGRAVMARIAAHPELFEIGNHTVHHCDLVNGGGGSPSAAPCRVPMTASFVRAELRDAEPALRRLSGMEPRPYWRPPYGSHDAWVRDQVAAVGYPITVGWNRDTIDWDPATTTAQIVARTTSPLPPSGSIVLAHLGGYKTGEALPQIIRVLRDAGYTMTTVSDLRDG